MPVLVSRWQTGSLTRTVGFTDPSRICHMGHDLRIADLETGAIETLDQAGFQPSWSPGGGRIAFMGLPTQGQRDIATIPVEGGEAGVDHRRLRRSIGALWAPDGRFLYFASNRGGAHNIWRVAIDQETGEVLGDFQDVTSGGTELQGFLSIAADGRSIVYAGAKTPPTSWRPPTTRERRASPGHRRRDHYWASQPGPFRHLAGRRVDRLHAHLPLGGHRSDASGRLGGPQLTDDPHNDRRPRFSPDGEQIYFYSNRDGSSQVWSIRPDGTGRTLITGADERLLVHRPLARRQDHVDKHVGGRRAVQS